MSMYLQAEEGSPVEVATNTGWGLFTEAVAGQGDELTRLADEGISEDPETLLEEVKAFLKTKPDKNVRGIARNVLEFLDGGPKLVMTSDGRELDLSQKPDEEAETKENELKDAWEEINDP